jgi:hypothetical protein
MKAPPGPARMPGKAKPKAKDTSRASKPRKSATKSASRLIDQRIRDLGGWRGRPWPACGR